MENITKAQYEFALQRIEELLPLVHDDTPLDDRNSVELDIVSDIVERYEQIYYPVDKPTLGSLMRESLFEMGITAKELAKQVGVSASRISDYIHDKSEPSLSTTRRIVHYLKLSPEQVLAI